ncbi:MAG: DUF2680 domain-containing protein [Anaerolineaceae bacterium]|nr:MAG: DUF2680 domain-containing protein [Anaerolineaceae bacterium]
MKRIKKLLIVAVVIGVFGVAGTAFAASSLTPAEIVANLTGKTVQEIYEVRAEGRTLASIVNDEGKLEDFQNEILKQKKELLDQSVKEGILTQEEADEIYQNIKDNIANRNFEGNAGTDRQFGSCFGRGYGMGFGRSRGRGNGMGMGLGKGLGRR